MFLGRDLFKGREVSEQTAREIDEEVRNIIEFSYNRAKEIISQNRDRLVTLAEALIEHETLDASEIEQIIETGSFTPPPTKLSSDSPTPAKQPKPEAAASETAILPPPSVGQAPASA
jgi:cell division protease FtsH